MKKKIMKSIACLFLILVASLIYVQCFGIKVGTIQLSYNDYSKTPEVIVVDGERWELYSQNLEDVPLYYNFTSEWADNERILYRRNPGTPTVLKVDGKDLSNEYSGSGTWYDWPYDQIHDIYYKYFYGFFYALKFGEPRPGHSHYSGVDGISPFQSWFIVYVIILCFITWSSLIIKALKYVD